MQKKYIIFFMYNSGIIEYVVQSSDLMKILDKKTNTFKFEL